MFHSRKRRERKIAQLEKSCKTGLFHIILTELERKESIKQDYREFLQAKKKFQINIFNITRLQSKERQKERLISGQYIASILSLFLGLASFLAMLFMR